MKNDALKQLERMARFTEGESADPTKHMSPEDAAKWKEMNEKHRDKFKTAAEEALAKLAVGDIPADVERYVKEIKDGNPDYTEAQVWATAWSIYCKHKNPGSDHCQMPTSEYFKSAMSELARLAGITDPMTTTPDNGMRKNPLDPMATWEEGEIDLTDDPRDHESEGSMIPGLEERLAALAAEAQGGKQASKFPPVAVDLNKVSNSDGFWGWELKDAAKAAGFPFPLRITQIGDAILFLNVAATKWEDSGNLEVKADAKFPRKAVNYNKVKDSDGFWNWSLQEAARINGMNYPIRGSQIGDLIFYLNMATVAWERVNRNKKSADADPIMAELALMAEGCPDNLDDAECKEWEGNTEKYKDVVKDQHAKTANSDTMFYGNKIDGVDGVSWLFLTAFGVDPDDADKFVDVLERVTERMGVVVRLHKVDKDKVLVVYWSYDIYSMDAYDASSMLQSAFLTAAKAVGFDNIKKVPHASQVPSFTKQTTDKKAGRVVLTPPAAIRAKIPNIGETESTPNPTVWIKYFSPYSNAYWLITEWDGKDEMFGWAEIHPGMGELGYMSLSELAGARWRGLPAVERDLYYKPKPLSQAKAEERRNRGIENDADEGKLASANKVAARPLYEIADEIRQDWKRPYFGAVPYLDAMESLKSINDSYYADDARSVVAYFLANASAWRGPVAVRIKAELKGLLKSGGGHYAADESDDDGDDGLLARYEEGVSVDPTKEMSPEDAAEWKENTDKYENVVKDRHKQAMEFDTPAALEKYLRDHPGADKSKHTVKKQEEKEEGGTTSPINLSRDGYKAVSKALEGFEEPGSWAHVITNANAGKPIDPKHTKKVVADIDNYLRNWKEFSTANRWTAADKKNLTHAKGILEGQLKKTAGHEDKEARGRELPYSVSVKAVDEGVYLVDGYEKATDANLGKVLAKRLAVAEFMRYEHMYGPEIGGVSDNQTPVPPAIVEKVKEGITLLGKVDLNLDPNTKRYTVTKARYASKEADLEDACWDGYEAIGMKDKGGKEVPNCVPKEASATGLYGFKKATQTACEASSRKVAKMASKLAKEAFKKDAEVAPFLAAHAKRGKSLSAQILVAAMKDLGPKVASDMRLAALRAERLPEATMTKEAARKYGLYGYSAKTASLGLQACTALREATGTFASELHGRKAAEHADITGFLKEHAKHAKCMYSRMLVESYPDADRKTASARTPTTVTEWLAWED